ncbi:MAG: hypothetical protein IJ379_06985 [Lachnospiraceae bacterium]|nr:hypothetical protein [Lachnospiraceae bacterium]
MQEYILAESKNYIIFGEYETVTLVIKETGRRLQIGDFYGDPEMAVISEDERYCVMCGCGVIVYCLEEPFQEYRYHTETQQWREWGREQDAIVWVESVRFVDAETIEVVLEDGKRVLEKCTG